MKYFGLDTETDDPLLKDQGPSWVYDQGEVLVTGLYDVAKQKKRAIDGSGGLTTRSMLFSASTCIVGANIGYDMGWLCHELGIKARDLKCELIDVAIAESLIDEYQSYSLDALAYKYLRERKGSEVLADIAVREGFRGDFRAHLKKLWYGETPSKKSYKDEIRDYVISDADQPTRIWEKQYPILEEQGLMPAFIMNMKIVKITLGMKQHGVRIDYDKWLENCEMADIAYEALKESFIEKYGDININSSKQVAALFDKFGVPFKYKIVFKGWAPENRKFMASDWFSGDEVWDQRKRLKESFPNIRVVKGKVVLMVPKQYAERTAYQAQQMGYQITCNPSVGKFAFAATKATHQVSADIVEYKQITNIITKFLGPGFGRFFVRDKNGDYRLHGNFDPVGARQTGRLSGSKPNLQNIPSKTMLKLPMPVIEKLLAQFPNSKAFVRVDGKYTGEINLATMCREVFIADRGHMFVKIDYSGQENVLQAHFAVGKNGELIRQMYINNPRLDEHQFVAERSGLLEQYGEKNGRKYAKNVRFGIAYGMQIITMCEQFGWEKEFAEELMEAVKEAAPWVPETMDAIQDMLLGRNNYRGRARRYIRTIIGRRIHLREGNDRDAYKFYNYTIQGSASDMMKMALIKFSESKGIKRVGDEWIVDEETSLIDTMHLLITVHDEGGFSVPMTPQGIAAVLRLQKIFVGAVELSIPINADPEAGYSWASAEGQKKLDGVISEPVEVMLQRVSQKLLSGKADIVDKTENVWDDDEVIDFDALGEEDEEEEGED